MRYNINKKQSTKAERIIYETLKKLHIPFKHRWIIKGHEIDFLMGKYILEIDGHNQPNSKKNEMLIKEGYYPVHLRNQDVYKMKTKLEEFLKFFK